MLAGAAIIGSNGTLVKVAGTPPTISAFWRMLFAAIFLLAPVLLLQRWSPLSRRTWWCIAIAGIAFAGDLWFWHRSILLVGPGLATLLANSQVFFMALAGVLIFGERLRPRFLAGLLLAFIGLWLLLGGHWMELPAAYHWGVWLGLAAGICYAAYNLGLRGAQREVRGVQHGHGPVHDRDHRRGALILQVLGLSSLMSAVFLGMAGVAERAAFTIPGWQSLLVLLVLAGFGHCLSWVMISRAMAHLRVAMIGLLLLLQPIVAFLLDVAIFDRLTTPREWLGLVFSLAGIFLAGLKGPSRVAEQPA